MKTTIRIFLYVSLLMFALTACAGRTPLAGGEDNVERAVTDIESFRSKLEEGGSAVTVKEEISQPFFTVPGQVVEVDGFEYQVFEFPDESAAAAAAASISADGSSVGTSMVTWIEPPHFFQSGKLIVLYLGEDAKALSLVEALLGPQIAGR